MRVAIISDIHANLQALQAILLDIEQNNIDSIVCLGDIVGYGPRPKQVLEEVTCRTENIILGNHDAVIGNRLNPNEFNDNAHEAIDWTRECLGDDSAKFFGKVPTTLQFDDILCVHAEAAEPENWNYITNPESALPSFLTTDASLIFMGHTHLPGIFSFDPVTQQVTQNPPQDSFFNPHQRHLINVGSVGDPRDGDINACYSILDMESQHVSFRRIPFDYEAFRTDQLSTGLKHKSWFLKLIDSQAQDIAPMGDMTARPTSLVTGHINRQIPSISLSPLVNTPTKLASAEKSQNRLAFFGVAAIVICFIGLVMIIGSNSNNPPEDSSDTPAVADKKKKRPNDTPPVNPSPNPTRVKPAPPSIVKIPDPAPAFTEPPVPDPIPDPTPDPESKITPPVAQGEMIDQLAEAFFAKDHEKTKTLAEKIDSDDSELKELTIKFINADKTILESFRPEIGKKTSITFTKNINREVRIEKISATNLTCSTIVSGERRVKEFTPADFDLRFRIARLASADDPIRYLYGGIEAAHSDNFPLTRASFDKLPLKLRSALKRALIKDVVAAGQDELFALLDENSIPVVDGDLEKTIDAIWSGSVDLEATKSLPGKIDLIRRKLTAVEASANPLDSKLASLQKAFSTDYRQGLIAEFYENREHQGRPVLTRIDLIVDFDWGEEAPAPDVAKDSFSTTWTGFIKPLESGTYEFMVELDDRGSIGFLQSNPNSIQGTYENNTAFELTLEAGTFYPFEIKHIEGWGKAKAKFHWRLKGKSGYTIVPKKVLFYRPPGE